jgi:hypothetical protein
VLLHLGDIADAIKVIVDAYVTDQQILLMLPIPQCVALLDDSDPDSMGDPLLVSVICDLYLRYLGDDRPFIRSDAYEDFLANKGVEKPSDIIVDEFQDERRHYLLYFLQYVCVPEVMSNSGAFSGSKSLEFERINVCSLLLLLDPVNSAVYEKELRDITRKQIVSEGLRDVEQSKFAIDVQPLRRWAEKNLKESFGRFQALRLAGVKAEAQ